MSVHATYAEAFTRFAGELSADERAARAQAFAAFTQQGFPDSSQERWHYTDLSPLAQQAVQLAATPVPPDLQDYLLPDCDAQIWINGRNQNAATSTTAMAAARQDDDGLASLNRAFARGGLQLDINAGQQQLRPLQVLLLAQAQQAGEMHHLAHRISLARGGSATVILHSAGLAGAEYFTTQQLQIELAEAAQLTLICVQQDSASGTQLLRNDARIGRDAQLRLINVDLGGKLVRKDWRLQLAEPGAQLEVHGLFASEGRTHLDNQYEVEHAAPHGSSRQYFRGLGGGRSKTILNDRVLVRPGAMKTDSEQRIRNLILDKGAEIDAKPELEIYADDVKCAHGNSCGQLDETAVFYLRSRGVPQAQARALLTYSFVDAVLAQIPIATLRQRLARIITRRLGAELDLEVLAS